MKKILFLLAMMFVIVFSGYAQNTTIQTSGVFTKVYTVKDSLNKDDSVIYSIYTPSFIEAAKLQVTNSQIGGTSKTTTIIQSSLDFVNWTNLDTVTVTGTGALMSNYINPRTQYLRFITKAVDSTQSTVPKYHFLIDKK
jgi:hypothetical protein